MVNVINDIICNYNEFENKGIHPLVEVVSLVERKTIFN